MNTDDNGRVTLAVLKKEIDHISEALGELKQELKEITKEDRFVHKDEFQEFKHEVTHIRSDVNKLKNFHVYMVALASIVSPIVILILRYLIGGLFGS